MMGCAPGGNTAAEHPRILVAAPQPFYENRGTPIAVLQVLRALSQLGFRVDVLTLPIGESPAIPGITYVRLPNPSRFRHVPVGLSARKLFFDALMLGPLARLLRSGRYACVHAVEEAAFPAVFLARRYGVPVIYDMQSSLPQQLANRRVLGWGLVQRVLRLCEGWLLDNANLVVSSTGLSRHVQTMAPDTRVQEWAFVGDETPVDRRCVESVRSELLLDPDARAIVYTGTFEDYQGVQNLLSAMPAIRRVVPEAVLILVGADNGAGQKLTALARREGQERSCHVVPRLPREHVAPYLAMADVLVSPRILGDNLPLKVFDYLAAGRPIVATDLPAHRRVLDAERAVLVRPDVAALADGITRVLTDPTTADRLARAARSYAEANMSWSRFVDSVGAIYDELLGRPRTPT